jgi:glucokinase
MPSHDTLILAGDIGATKTRLAVFAAGAGGWAPLATATFVSRDFASLEALVSHFLSGVDDRPERAGFGVAGPVVNDRARLTNLPWVVDARQLAQDLGLASVRLVNDLQAIAAAVPSLEAEDVHTLNPGRVAPGGAMAVVAPGTGLGEAYLVWDGAGYRAFPSEGGHADFAPADARQAGLLLHLLERFEHVSYERVCSGSGIPNIYAYLKDSGQAAEPDWLREALDAVHDPVPVIVRAAMDGERPCALCRAALDMFVAILGAAAGNAALQLMATGGVYLGGGIPPRILPALGAGPFMDAFQRKGRMAGLMGDIPVHVILDPGIALRGAAREAMASAG